MEHLREDEQAPYGPFFGQLGVTFSMAFAAAGAAYATAKVDLLLLEFLKFSIWQVGTSLSMVCIRKPDLFMKGIIPVVMASVNVIYGLVLAVIISGKINVGGTGYPVYEGFAHCAAGLVCGLSALGVGYAFGDSGIYSCVCLDKPFSKDSTAFRHSQNSPKYSLALC